MLLLEKTGPGNPRWLRFLQARDVYKRQASSGSKAESSAASSSASGEEKTGGFKVAYIARNQSDPFAAELVNQFTLQAEQYKDTFTLDT